VNMAEESARGDQGRTQWRHRPPRLRIAGKQY
jgi:hypothetical protein